MANELRTWREHIVALMRDNGGEIHVDAIHEGTDGDEDLEEAMQAVEDLEREGVLWDDHGMLKVRSGVDLGSVK